ncbi:Hsp33 family molecular chaperone HslO [Legionella dresdenensis]|uniref:Hsp33 family molecular chaperone HslO n=1 Tax=Legionella dresdenensis TaxID=450200 RepID=A0ABV8CI00_9GAMM
MNEKNSLQHFMFQHAAIRGEIAHLDSVYTTIMEQRDYPPIVRHLLGEALVACMLITGSIKFEGELSLQFQGDSRLPLLLVQCDYQLNMRAFAKYKEDLETRDYAEAFLSGQMVLTINHYNQTQSYQSMVPLESTSMSENLMNYFAQSEQIPTWIRLAANEHGAAGMLLQLMPDQDVAQRENFWEYAVQIGQTITDNELFTLDNETVLYRLYNETDVLVFDPRPARFKCRCNAEKMKQVIKILGEEDANNLITERGKLEITCDFCNSHYAFDAIDITMMFHHNK